MTASDVPHPPIVSREQWLDERKKLLAEEKELTKHYDRVNAARRRLPMVKIEKNYLFEAPGGELSLKDLFEVRRQLIVYHFMFDPARSTASACSFIWATTSSTLIRPTHAVPKRLSMPADCST